MQNWIVGGVWLFAVLFAIVVLGFAAYELIWKVRRLQVDQAKLQTLITELAGVGEQLSSASDRLQR